MGRNGKNTPVFMAMTKVVNDNVGKVISAIEMLAGNRPGRNAATSYIYKFIALGYVEIALGATATDSLAMYRVLKAFPSGYTSVMMKRDMQLLANAKDC